jgi:hypothetical protein
MRTLAYVILVGALLALVMFLSGPHIKAHGTQWRAHNRTISTMQDGAHYFGARLLAI